MKKDKNPTGDGAVIVTPLAYTKITLHAVANPCQPIHGILVGNQCEGNLRIVDALPVCHSHPTRTILNMAFRLAESHLLRTTSTNTTTIVGWYTAAERLDDTKASPAVFRILSTIHSTELGIEPVLLCIQNSKFTNLMEEEEDEQKDTASTLLQGYSWDAQNKRTTSIPVVLVQQSSGSPGKTLAALRTHCSGFLSSSRTTSRLPIYDFENHLEEGGSSHIQETDWLVNRAVVDFLMS